MNHREALDELGLTPEAPRGEIRRAYLKLLKTRKPDTDQAGFMRLREAYELLTSGTRVVLTLGRPTEIDVATMPERVARGPADDGESEAKANSSNDEGADQSSFVQNPGEDSEPAAAESVANPDEVLERLGAKAAVNLYVAIIDRCTSTGSAPPFPPFAAIRLTLLLQHADKPASARQLIASYSAWLKATGAELRLLQRGSAAAWVVARELAALGSLMPFDMKQPIAAAALDGDLSLARDGVMKAAAQHAKSLRSIRTALAAYAPSLNAAFGRVLYPGRAASRATIGIRLALMALVLSGIIGISRCLFREMPPDTATLALDPLARCKHRLESLAVSPHSVRMQSLAQDLEVAIGAESCDLATSDLRELLTGLADDPTLVEGCEEVVKIVCAKDGATK